MTDKYHQYYKSPQDGSECVRAEPGDPWTLLSGDGGSDACKLANQQNKFYRPWMKESIRRHEVGDDVFSKRNKKL